MVISKFTGFEGHIVLYCKGHYNISSNPIEDLKKIWAIRCGYEYNINDNSMVKNIIDNLYKLVISTVSDKTYFQEMLHEHLLKSLYKTSTTSEKLVLFYMSRIQNIQIKKQESDKWITIIKLPKPNKQVINRILRGNGKYEDYKLIKENS